MSSEYTVEELRDLADDLNEAYSELRRVPLGGRGHISDACLDAAGIIRGLAEALAAEQRG